MDTATEEVAAADAADAADDAREAKFSGAEKEGWTATGCAAAAAAAADEDAT